MSTAPRPMVRTCKQNQEWASLSSARTGLHEFERAQRVPGEVAVQSRLEARSAPYEEL